MNFPEYNTINFNIFFFRKQNDDTHEQTSFKIKMDIRLTL